MGFIWYTCGRINILIWICGIFKISSFAENKADIQHDLYKEIDGNVKQMI